MRFSSYLLSFLLLAFASGCGWATALSTHDDGSVPSDFGRRDFGPIPDGGFPDFGPIPDGGGFPDIGFDSGPRPCEGEADCSDRLFCTGIEVCVGGMCAPGTPPRCDDGIPCTDDGCDEASRGCVNIPNSALCPADQVCRAGLGCQAVACMTSLECTDGVFCNGAETCGSDSRCHGGPPPCGTGPGGCGPICSEASHSCAMPIPDADGDGFRNVMCGGDDCNDADPRVFPGNAESCDDGVDNDCNGAVDCSDPACSGAPGCGCVSRPEDCTNGLDDDCNGLVDCNDMTCLAIGACSECVDHEAGSVTGRHVGTGTNIGAPTRTIPTCGSSNPAGRDRTYRWTAPMDADYVFDTIGSTFDTVLYLLAGCGGAEIGCDDDGSGLGSTSLVRLHLAAGATVIIIVDTFGSGIGSTGTYYLSITTGTTMSEFPFCADGVDNDGDGAIDCADVDCVSSPSCPSMDAGRPDGGRPDGGRPDGGTLDGGGCPSTIENTVAMCTNGRDDDCDTRVDCGDPDCSPFGPAGECCNGIDDNADGQIDEFTCRCFSDTDCLGVGSLDQTCWATTFHVCAPNCNFVGGTAGFCRCFFGSTSTCNAVTGECDGAVLGGGTGCPP